MDEGSVKADDGSGRTVGGTLSDTDVEKMAAAALAGIDPRAYLNAESDLELALLDRIATRAIDIQTKQRSDLAKRIIAELDRALKRKRSSPDA